MEKGFVYDYLAGIEFPGFRKHLFWQDPADSFGALAYGRGGDLFYSGNLFKPQTADLTV